MKRFDLLDHQFEIAEEALALYATKMADLKSAVDNDQKALALGRFFEATNDLSQAEMAYSVAASNSQAPAEALARGALVALKQGDTRRGQVLAAAAAANSPDLVFPTLTDGQTSILTVLGDAAKASSDYARAVELYERARDRVPEDAHAAGGLATCLVALGKVEEASSLAPHLTHPSYRGLRAVLELASPGAVGPRINNLQQISRSLLGKYV